MSKPKPDQLAMLKNRYSVSADECFASVNIPLSRVKSVGDLERHSLEMLINQMAQAVRDLSKLQALMEVAQ